MAFDFYDTEANMKPQEVRSSGSKALNGSATVSSS